jgi:uncharacterized membrane protein YphA (DoxX/SURF4 family)
VRITFCASGQVRTLPTVKLPGLMLPSPQTYSTWLAVLRIFTGIFWLCHGVPKLLNPRFYGPEGMMAGMLRDASTGASGPYNSFILHVALPNADLVSHLVAWGETLVGVSLLLGLLTRVGGIFGVFLPLNYFLMKGSYAHLTSLGGLDAAAMALSFINIVLPTGLVFGLDALLPISTGRRPAAKQ